MGISASRRNDLPLETICFVCGKSFRTYPSWIKAGKDKFCSKECQTEYRSHTKIERQCVICGKSFTAFTRIVNKGYALTCSRAGAAQLFSIKHSGENAPHWKGGKIEKVCGVCGNTFSVKAYKVKNGRGRYCSRSCSAKDRVFPPRKSPYVLKERVECTCQTCGKAFHLLGSAVRNGEGKFCSRKCFGKSSSLHRIGENSNNWQGKTITKKCEYCDVAFAAYEANHTKFCSKACASMWSSVFHRGDKCYQWRGGPVTLICQQCGVAFLSKRSVNGKRKYCSRKCAGVALTLHPERLRPSAWNDKLRDSIRKRDDYSCQNCDEIQGRRNHAVHHIDYKIRNNEPNNLITLCVYCHGMTNINRIYWQSTLSDLISTKYTTIEVVA